MHSCVLVDSIVHGVSRVRKHLGEVRSKISSSDIDNGKSHIKYLEKLELLTMRRLCSLCISLI